MSMSEMVCCAEHHGECEMAGMTEACCGTSQHADIGMLEPERADDASALATVATYHSAVATTPPIRGLGLSAPSGTGASGSLRASRTNPHLAHTVLLI